MTIPFDIFRKEGSGKVLWLGAAATIEDAKARVREIAVRAPGEYLILDQQTGNKHLVQDDGADGLSRHSNEHAGKEENTR